MDSILHQAHQMMERPHRLQSLPGRCLHHHRLHLLDEDVTCLSMGVHGLVRGHGHHLRVHGRGPYRGPDHLSLPDAMATQQTYQTRRTG